MGKTGLSMNLVQKQVRRTRKNDEWFQLRRRYRLSNMEKTTAPLVFHVELNNKYFVFIKVHSKEWTPIVSVTQQSEALEIVKNIKLLLNTQLKE
tara:strand:+ start:185 stop:466 length:282 start_codon:yes stop_codon:yes gene_type:complete